ncbi:MAG: response regulator transcription factor [Arcobacteraceae bacterium]|jgi:DNA-binding response OmpR family regulator|nr:response regulator transcription factor [Arcobacteraceae bacterium]
MKILLLEDDFILNEILLEFLQSLHYDVVSVFDGQEAQTLAYEQLFDLFILDVNVPLIDGFSFLKELRKRAINTPAIFITSLNRAEDLKQGFESGCDDYIKKPFELQELALRINNIKRLFNIENNAQVHIAQNITYNTDTFELNNNGIKTTLPKKEAKILEYFLKNENKIISSDELSVNIWSYEEYPLSSTIRTYIKNLRKLLGEEAITTLKGVGYRFNKR